MLQRSQSLASVLAVTVGLGLISLAVSAPASEDKDRNPFGVRDVPDPDGNDVKDFADKVKLPGGADDENAKSWTDNTVKGNPKSLDSDWASRWNGGSAGTDWIAGAAQVKGVSDRVYILYVDKTGTYLIDAHRVGKDRLVGGYLNQGVPSDSYPWVGRIVDPERIDGEWTMGRWDLRRKLADK